MPTRETQKTKEIVRELDARIHQYVKEVNQLRVQLAEVTEDARRNANRAQRAEMERAAYKDAYESLRRLHDVLASGKER